jgi:hypothetical protein
MKEKKLFFCLQLFIFQILYSCFLYDIKFEDGTIKDMATIFFIKGRSSSQSKLFSFSKLKHL